MRSAVGPAPRNLQLTKSGRIFYAAFNGLPAEPLCGGVAILSLLEMACGDIFKHILNPCPACADDSHHCVVLATVKDYVYGNQIIDDFSCRCANDGECSFGQICYTQSSRSCGPPCNQFVGDVCPFVAPGSACNPAIGQCVFP